ncbi:FBXW8 [Branchiostoma lanceolatum]|uniref:FBXW8 protein n=1 Tax=Branchiostoma lanceolatum TaxID=7740 RepID=A0A8J9W210_BRALA|nr:FBXW8 [Branchiostoma lanceolatum]CAH1233833.1 FBXW8 [Branchiostoma lanceolatum]CAH1233835.1 FBXW8 [Branchiostoma lanceolatum]CAH1233837.1 FBXW8 [Branchiostoma lanceolatum]
MARPDELSKFVEQWKQEIHGSNHKEAAGPSGQGQDLRVPRTQGFGSVGSRWEGGSGTSKQQQQESRTLKTPPDQLPPQPSCKQDSSNPHYPPFMLADRLLQGETTESLSEERRSRKRLKPDACPGPVSPARQGDPQGTRHTLLEQLISDLDEINEIPFFEVSLPRELALQIFQHLSMEDLCRCAQVSSSWRSLADDEVLWQKVGRSLGCDFSADRTAGQKSKEVVKTHIETDRMVTGNWKSRVGQIDYLECAIGGFLSAVNSCGTHIVAGFSKGIVRLWDILADENTPSVLLETTQEQEHAVGNVSVNPTVTVASFGSGDVSIWSTEHGGTPLHHFTLDQGGPPQVCTCPGGAVVASASGAVVRVDSPDGVGVWHCRQNFSCDKKVTHLTLVQKNEPPNKALSDHLVVMATDYDVYAHRPDRPPEERHRFHSLYGAVVECLDATAERAAVASTCFGVSLEDVFKVQCYCLDTGKQLTSLRGHRGQVTCMNLRNSPPNMLVTGAADKRVRVFDLRTPRPVLNQYAHPLGVSCVQMDDWKVVSGGREGSLCVWDLRTQNKLWEMKPSKVHPIQYCRFGGPHLIAACYPGTSSSREELMDQYRHQPDVKGRINVYDFSVDQTTRDVPDICKADYDEPEGYNYNISLAMPYDAV